MPLVATTTSLFYLRQCPMERERVKEDGKVKDQVRIILKKNFLISYSLYLIFIIQCIIFLFY